MKRRPDRDEIFEQVIACGLRAGNVVFSVDSEGVDSAHISPAAESESTYRAGMLCLMQWAAESGAAMGFDILPMRKQ